MKRGFLGPFAVLFLVAIVSHQVSANSSSAKDVMVSPQSRLRDQLKLPVYLDKKFGLMSVEDLKTRLGIKTPPKSLMTHEELARSFWRALPVLDESFALAIEGLPSGILESWSVNKLLARSEESQDSWTSLWWEMKFSLSEQRLEPRTSSSKTSLMLVRQYGFGGLSQSDWLSRVQDKLNMGHTALALRYTGESASRDVYFHFTDEEQPSLLQYNFWQWTQTQIELRFTKVDLWVTPLSSQQERALQKLMTLPELPKIFSASSSQEGTRRLLSFLSPIEAVKVNIMDTFFERAHLFQFPHQAHNNPHTHVPDVDFTQIQFPDADNLSTFRDYRAWEKQLMRSGPSPASLHP